MTRFINKSDIKELLEDELNCIRFLCDEGLLNTQKLCSEYDSPMNLNKLSYFVRERRHKRIRTSCAKDTWFEKNENVSFASNAIDTLFYIREFV